ncbi:MAG: hypothetical protein U0359_25400 [Byssovorax sp.]
MAGKQVSVLGITDYNCNFATGSTPYILVVSRPIYVVDWVSGVLAVRLHRSGTWDSGTATVDVVVQNIMPAPDEPQTVFVPSSGEVASITIPNAPTAPALYQDAFEAPIAAYVRVILKWTQGASAGACPFAISVDLIGRDA